MPKKKPYSSSRLFFGLNLHAPWPTHFPPGRLIAEAHRHCTLLFLGEVKEVDRLKSQLSHLPPPPFKIGSVGRFSHPLLLPSHHPRVLAWEMEELTYRQEWELLRQLLLSWLQEHNLAPELYHPFCPHATLARAPFFTRGWQEAFYPLPLFSDQLILYETVASLTYIPVWHYSFLPPFEAISHTADLAFLVRGEGWSSLLLNALIALSFSSPSLLHFVDELPLVHHLEELIATLNHLIMLEDEIRGTPFKAVTYHGQLQHEDSHYLSWEMIVDV